MLTNHTHLTDINLELRFQMYVIDPIVKALGQPQSSTMIASCLNAGVNRTKLEAVVADIEELAAALAE